MSWMDALLSYFAGASLLSTVAVVLALVIASPVLVSQCCKKKTEKASPTTVVAAPKAQNAEKIFGPDDDVLLCNTQDETLKTEGNNKASPVVPQPTAAAPSPVVDPKAVDKTCIPVQTNAATNIVTVNVDPDLKSKTNYNVSAETVETKRQSSALKSVPKSAPLAKPDDKFINKGGGLFVDKDNKAISQYTPPPLE